MVQHATRSLVAETTITTVIVIRGAGQEATEKATCRTLRCTPRGLRRASKVPPTPWPCTPTRLPTLQSMGRQRAAGPGPGSMAY
ncbi:hypothetical protein FOA52_014872 [Chlamydomonas sp. UWO 241]|nr:hypothetical protein FOA52_014872 [Chlamydomonas sp. UWO 241]